MRVEMVTPDSDAWRSFLFRTPHDFYHLPEYVHLDAEHQGGRAVAFLAEDDERGLLVPLIVRPIGLPSRDDGPEYDAIGPYGFGSPLVRAGSGSDAAGFVGAAVERLCDELRDRRVVSAFLRLHPVLSSWPEILKQYGPVVHHGETVILDLTVTPEEMWQQTRENHRRGIRRAEKAGYSVEIDIGFQQLEAFHVIYGQTMRRVGAGRSYSFSLNYFRALKERLAGTMHLCVVRHGSEVACGGLFSETCGVVQYHLGGTRDEHLGHQPSKLMFHFIRGWARQRGNTALVLGAGVGGRNDELYHFKAGFSRLSAPFRTWRLIADARAYSRLVDEWERRHQAAADASDGFFPAYRKALFCQVPSEVAGTVSGSGVL
jgi:hypothetical protein